MDTFNITELTKKEMNEYENERIDYIKVKTYYGLQRKRTYQEMIEERLDIKSPHPSELPMTSAKIFNKN